MRARTRTALALLVTGFVLSLLAYGVYLNFAYRVVLRPASVAGLSMLAPRA